MRKLVTTLSLLGLIALTGCSKAGVSAGDMKIEIGKEKETTAEYIPVFEDTYFDRIVAYDKDGIKIVAENLVYKDGDPYVSMTFTNNTKMSQRFVSQIITVNDCITHTDKEYIVEPEQYSNVEIPITGLDIYGIDGSKDGNMEDLEMDILVYSVQDENAKIPIDISGYTAESGTIFIDLVDEYDKSFKYNTDKGLKVYDKNGIELVITDLYYDEESKLPVINMYAHNYGKDIMVLDASEVMLNDNIVISNCRTIIDPEDYLATPFRFDTVKWSEWKDYYKETGNVDFVKELDFTLGSTTYQKVAQGSRPAAEKFHVKPDEVLKAKNDTDDINNP